MSFLGRVKNFARLTSSSSSPTNQGSSAKSSSPTVPSSLENGVYFPSSDELVIVNIVEFLGVMDIIVFANVCSDWRRVCESELVNLQFTNHLYSRDVYGQIYREIDIEKYYFFGYFSSIKINSPHTIESNSIHRLLKSKKCEKLSLRNFKINFSEICKQNIAATSVKKLELGKCEIDSLDYFDRVFPNLKHFKFSGTIQRPSLHSFVRTTFKNLETFNFEIQNEDQFISLITPKKVCPYMQEFQLYSKMQNCGDYLSNFNREFFPNMKSLFLSMHSAYNEKLLQNCNLEVDTLRIRARVSSIFLSNLKNLVHLEVKTVSSLDNLSLPHLKTLILDSNYDPKPHSVKLPNMHLPILESLTISDKKAKVELINLIQFSKLKILDIDCSSMESLKTMQELKNLEDISLGSYFKEGDITHLEDLKITKLKVYSPHTSNGDMTIISKLENLKHLEITLENKNHYMILSDGSLSNLTYLKCYKTKRMDYKNFQSLTKAKFNNLLQIKFQNLDVQSVQDLFLSNPFPKLRILKLRKSFDFRKNRHLELMKLLVTSSENSPIQEIHVKCKGDYTNNKEVQQMIEKSSRLLFVQPKSSKK